MVDVSSSLLLDNDVELSVLLMKRNSVARRVVVIPKSTWCEELVQRRRNYGEVACFRHCSMLNCTNHSLGRTRVEIGPSSAARIEAESYDSRTASLVRHFAGFSLLVASAANACWPKLHAAE